MVCWEDVCVGKPGQRQGLLLAALCLYDWLSRSHQWCTAHCQTCVSCDFAPMSPHGAACMHFIEDVPRVSKAFLCNHFCSSVVSSRGCVNLYGSSTMELPTSLKLMLRLCCNSLSAGSVAAASQHYYAATYLRGGFCAVLISHSLRCAVVWHALALLVGCFARTAKGIFEPNASSRCTSVVLLQRMFC